MGWSRWQLVLASDVPRLDKMHHSTYEILPQQTFKKPLRLDCRKSARKCSQYNPLLFIHHVPCIFQRMSRMSTQPTVTDGKINFSYGGETFQTYYKLHGSIVDCTKDPLIVLHGGPGLVHNYLDVHSNLAATHDIPVILYDQLGNGQSTHLREKAQEFWTVDLFIAELENLIAHFGIQDGYSILGHSWGGILASEFEVRKQPPGLKRLIVADSLAASSLWNKSNAQLLQAFPEDVQQGVAGGMKDPEKFGPALQKFHARHGCTIVPVPEELSYTMLQVFGPDGDPTVAAAP